MEDNFDKKQILTIENRKRLSVDRVKNIESFNEEYLEIYSELGVICVEGAELKIEELSGKVGQILVTGVINGVYYKEEKPQKRLFTSIFK